MIFQDNIIKEYLRNVYFISGTACGGKTTVSKALGKKYGIPVYDIDEQFTIHQVMSDKDHQPTMNTMFRDADEFFGRSVEEYTKWLLGNKREQLDFIIMDLIRLSRDRVILCDLHITVEEAEKLTDPSRIAFMIAKPINIVDTYCNRPDHQPFNEFIHSATDYGAAKDTCDKTLTALNTQAYNDIQRSDFFWVERDNSRSVEDTVALVEKHFGWRQLNDLSIQKVDKGSYIADELLSFIENCSWDEVKEHMCGLVKNWEFTDWETMFVAKADGKIVGMVSVMKEDYYPMPETYPWVSCLFVSEEYRGLRICEKLINHANGYLKEQGFDKSYIPTPIENVGLYERYGYSFVKEIVNYGDGVDLLYSKEI
jgi:ribosomal protein S18 acetylase RimI-like enzyme